MRNKVPPTALRDPWLQDHPHFTTCWSQLRWDRLESALQLHRYFLLCTPPHFPPPSPTSAYPRKQWWGFIKRQIKQYWKRWLQNLAHAVYKGLPKFLGKKIQWISTLILAKRKKNSCMILFMLHILINFLKTVCRPRLQAYFCTDINLSLVH